MQEKSKHFAWALARVMVEIPSQSFHHSAPLTLTICIQRGLNPVRCQIPGLVAHCASENTFLCLSFFTVPASGLRLLRARHCLSYIIHLFHIWHMFLQIVCSWVKSALLTSSWKAFWGACMPSLSQPSMPRWQEKELPWRRLKRKIVIAWRNTPSSLLHHQGNCSHAFKGQQWKYVLFSDHFKLLLYFFVVFFF